MMFNQRPKVLPTYVNSKEFADLLHATGDRDTTRYSKDDVDSRRTKIERRKGSASIIRRERREGK